MANIKITYMKHSLRALLMLGVLGCFLACEKPVPEEPEEPETPEVPAAPGEAKPNPSENAGSIEDYDENTLFEREKLCVGTYNILAADARDVAGANTWSAAKSTISRIISEMRCDVMTLNELHDTEISYLKTDLDGYEWILHHNENNSYRFAPGIIYRPSRLEKEADGIFWLNNPDATSLQTAAGAYTYDGYSAAPHRCCVWARFLDKNTGRSFYYFAAHPEIRGADADSPKANTLECLNAGNIRSLAAQIRLINSDNLPIVIAGDLNTHSKHISYDVFKSAGWIDAFVAASSARCISGESLEAPGTDVGTNPEAYVTNESRRVDFVLYSGFDIRSYTSIYSRYNGIYPSDHLPIKTELIFCPFLRQDL